MNKHLNVVVLMGGPSSEHEISLKSGAMVVSALNSEKYDVTPVTISKDGAWSVPIEDVKIKHAVDVAVIAMHGAYGEDGTLQALLNTHGIAYTGSGARASRLAMDKAASSRLMQSLGVRVPIEFFFTKQDWDARKASILKVVHDIGFGGGDSGSSRTGADQALVLKPADQGSSVGVSIVYDAGAIAGAIEKTFAYSESILAQEYIKGREVTCGVLDDGAGNAMALPPTEIIPNESAFFDYEAKYAKGGSKEITPAQMPQNVIGMVQDIALRAHETIGCTGMSRTDMIVRSGAAGRAPEVFYLETNTIPGMTETSLLPQAAAAVGISFSELIERMIGAALANHARS